MHSTSTIVRHAASALFLVATVAACARKFEPLPKFQGDAEFLLVHTEHNLGNIEPCSCNNRTTGGFPRRASALADLRSKHRCVITLDAGNSLFSENRKNAEKIFLEQSKVKAKAIAEAFVATGLDAMVFGEMDLLAGGDFFLDVVADTKLPIVAANVFDRATGKPYFEQYKIFDCDGLKIAVLGLVATELHPTISEANEDGSMMVDVNQKVTVILEDAFERRNVKIEDPIEVAKRLVPELLSKAHVIVALTHLSPTAAQNLPSQVPGISFVVGRHVPKTRAAFTIDPVTQSMALAAPMNGLTLGVGQFQVRGGGLSFEDYSSVDTCDLMIDAIQSALADLEKRYGTSDPESLSAIDDDAARKAFNQRSNLAYYLNMKESADPARRSHFKHYDIRLDGKEHGDDPKLVDHIKEYRAQLASLYDPADTTRSKNIERAVGMPHFVGAAACATCHRPQTEFWRNTKHGKAWQTMLDYKVEYDLECIGCHTVGFMLPGGFDRPDRVKGFEDVQCENCHGPGSAHLDNPLATRGIVSEASAMLCERCHNKEHSPAFKRLTYVPRASCPPIDPWEPLMRGSYAKMRVDLEEVLEKKGDAAPPHTFSGLVDIYLRLERFDDAIQLAERGKKIHARIALSMNLAIARALDGKGDSAAAIRLLKVEYERTQNDLKFSRLVQLLAQLLVHARDVSVRNLDDAQVLVDYAIDSFTEEDGPFRLLRAEIEHARGNRARAIELLEQLVKNSGVKSTALNAIVSRCKSELEAERENATPPPMRVPPSPN